MCCHECRLKHLCKSTEGAYYALDDLESGFRQSLQRQDVTLCPCFHPSTQTAWVIWIAHSAKATIPPIPAQSVIPSISAVSPAISIHRIAIYSPGAVTA